MSGQEEGSYDIFEKGAEEFAAWGQDRPLLANAGVGTLMYSCALMFTRRHVLTVVLIHV